MNLLDIAIIGAGPYGLSIAAYLQEAGVNFRIFGSPMQTWLTQMPEGMRLKSEGFASTLYDPQSACTLQKYCQERGLPYADIGHPVPLDTFSAYGLEFQRRMVPSLEDRQVVSLERTPGGFRLGLDDGSTVEARRVVAAVGISHYSYVPRELSGLSPELVTHTAQHTTFRRFEGREVLVVGGGASAVDVAASLLAAGASVQLVARDPKIRFHSPLQLPRPWMERIKSPMTGLGPGWRSLMCTEAPLLFRLMPEQFRLKVVRKHLGPAPGWFVREQVEGRVPFHLGWNLGQAKAVGGRVELRVSNAAGETRTFTADHLIAGTGYRVDLTRLAFLNPAVLAQIRSVEGTPELSSNFESSIPGLYFVGATSANSFGPLARFAYGAGFTSKRISRHLASLPRPSVVPGVAVADLKTIQDG